MILDLNSCLKRDRCASKDEWYVLECQNGASAVIALRCSVLSNRLEDFWERRTELDGQMTANLAYTLMRKFDKQFKG